MSGTAAVIGRTSGNVTRELIERQERDGEQVAAVDALAERPDCRVLRVVREVFRRIAPAEPNRRRVLLHAIELTRTTGGPTR